MWNAMADACIVGACLSIVPHASRLVALACHGMVMPEYTKHTHVRLAWLAYALSHPKRTGQLEHVEVLGLAQLPQHALDRVGDAVRSRVPLRDVISHALRATYQHQQQQEVQYLVLGTIVMVESGALLYRKPSLSEDALTQVATEVEELDAVAWLPASQWLGVVYPGFGLVWTRVGTSDGSQFTTTSTPTTKTMSAKDNDNDNSNNSNVASLAELLLIRSLVCSIDPRREPSTTPCSVVLQRLFIGPALQRLRLDQTLVTKHDLSNMLSCCTALCLLELVQCRVESLVPLVDSYFSASAAHVSSLALLWLTEDAEDQPLPHDQLLLEPVVAALERPDHPMTRTLGELRLGVDNVDGDAMSRTLERLATALRTKSALDKLTGLIATTDGQSGDRVARALAPLRDQLLPDFNRARCALLSVLQLPAREELRRRLPVQRVAARALSGDVMALIFAFVGSTRVRQIAVQWTVVYGTLPLRMMTV